MTTFESIKLAATLKAVAQKLENDTFDAEDALMLTAEAAHIYWLYTGDNKICESVNNCETVQAFRTSY